MTAQEAIKNPENLVTFMNQAKNEDHWNQLCDEVKVAGGGGYPQFWFATMIVSGEMNRILANPKADEIRFEIL